MNFSHWIIVHSFEIVGYLLAIILIPRILLERRHPGATIAWLLAIGLVPFIGVPLYFLIGGRRVKKTIKKKNWNMRNKDIFVQPPNECRLSLSNRRIANILIQADAFSPTSNNEVTIIEDGVAVYNTLFNLIENAKISIEIAIFILGRDEVGRAIVKLLTRKARQGVKIRLLLDALGCFRTRGRFTRELRDAGGSVGVFLPVLPFRRRWSANLRNHRKIAIIDGRQALVGGMNLAKKYIGPTPYVKRWKDVSMVITGGGVEHIRTIFFQDWAFSTGEAFDGSFVCSVAPSESTNGSIVQVVGDGPDISERVLYSGVLAALSQARKSVWVVTPYFVPDEPLSAALKLSARMGCDVRIVTPERSNHPLVDLAGSSFLPELVAAGVRFYRYQPGMLHAKLIAVDQQLAVVGSANMDIRSFQLNFEIATFLYDLSDVRQVIHVIETMMQESRQVTKKEIEQKSKIREFSEDICRVFSPLL